jgi:hypothetical protein
MYAARLTRRASPRMCDDARGASSPRSPRGVGAVLLSRSK